jgi:hypothetical protein
MTMGFLESMVQFPAVAGNDLLPRTPSSYSMYIDGPVPVA